MQIVDLDHSFVDLGTHTFWYTSGSSKNHLKMMLIFAACLKHMVWPWCLPLLLFIGGQYFHQYTMKLYFYRPYLFKLKAFNSDYLRRKYVSVFLVM